MGLPSKRTSTVVRSNGSYADLGVILMFASSGRSGLAKVGITQAADSRDDDTSEVVGLW